jgi:hypothetical protein
MICTTFSGGLSPFRNLFPPAAKIDSQTAVLDFIKANKWTSAKVIGAELGLSVAITRSALICLGLRMLIVHRAGKRYRDGRNSIFREYSATPAKQEATHGNA